ncbi:MAG TPA: DMT family transporter [Anaerolineales bacterium]|nr:DMT family transporter [Anaerolineales bacterium]
MTAAIQRSYPVVLYTALAMIAFASNSLLNRLALGRGAIDAVSYTTVRLVTGALILVVIALLQKNNGQTKVRGSWLSAGMLFLYAAAFSFAYLSLSAGTGALILFGSVQVTMILVALRSGERPHLQVWLGVLLALGGLVYLVMPGLRSPSLPGSLLMTGAGIAWGGYSLRGRGSETPLADTTGNFLYAVPFILFVRLVSLNGVHLSFDGVFLAVLSGAIASGLGYVIWYAALRGLTATRAAIVQLSVPFLAAWGGVMFLAEDVSLRLLFAGALILGGIALAVLGRVRAQA